MQVVERFPKPPKETCMMLRGSLCLARDLAQAITNGKLMTYMISIQSQDDEGRGLVSVDFKAMHFPGRKNQAKGLLMCRVQWSWPPRKNPPAAKKLAPARRT